MKIDLSHRNINKFDSSAFCSEDEKEILCSIEQLDLSHNNISSLGSLHSLTALTVLDVSHNNLMSLRPLPTTLRQLAASFNALRDLDGVAQLPRLEVLVVTNNHVTSLLGLPPTLLTLDVSANMLSSFTGVEKCTNLREVQARHNVVRSAEGLVSLRGLRSLKTLALAGNPVASSRRHFLAVQAVLPPSIATIDFPSTAAVLVSTSHSDTPPLRDATHLPGHSTDAHDATAFKSSSSSTAETEVSEEGNREKRVSSHKEEGWECSKEMLAYTMRTQSALEEVNNLGCRTAYTSVDVSQDTSDGRTSPQPIHSDPTQSVAECYEEDPMEYVLRHLQSELRCCQMTCESYEKANGELYRRVQALEHTNGKLADENAALLERLQKMQRTLDCVLSPPPGRNNFAGTFDGTRGVGEHSTVPSLSSHEHTSGIFSERAGATRDAVAHAKLNGSPSRSGKTAVGVASTKKAETRQGARSLAKLLMAVVPQQKAGTSPSQHCSVVDRSTNNNKSINNSSHCYSSTQSPFASDASCLTKSMNVSASGDADFEN
ncbi:hypothetical protein, conserved [Trypanosoma brucei gambiense DAL972]|uniref:Leucine-rich repeat protein (LRRP) n=1 Tax=Trypanosoma brucei gambiense (strain MHOM/CI/86/DAL972) TaxID=679716 RepID=D0A7J9_TRYB9|nr:hypothetical protein, conserved [Trypanosoma brucei gambiense DAL972]CBH17650.1 hypothetical protein, conserved [Trypanosoma brucei gambiense DAL972]|eukprot:XP_011779914.1 hypothetical protein, conserved [Trypanosoma brucei gambiense DAL972]